MDHGAAGLETLTHRERGALRALLVGATAAAGRPDAGRDLAPLVAAAPLGALPAAAALHRVSGTVLRGLDGVDGVPAAVRAALEARRHRASLHHLLVAGLLGQIGRRFDDAGLRWVVMKGPAVAALLYPDVGDRSYADLDLLVDRRDLGSAMQILEELGYDHVIHNWALAEEMLAGEVQLRSTALEVDLHWHVHYSGQDRHPFAVRPEAMIERRRRVAMSGVTAPTFDPVDTLLLVAFHAARSDGHRLIWLKDVERSVAVERPDLDELVRRAQAYRCAPPVGVILDRARGVLDAAVPDDVVRALTPAVLRAAARAVAGVADPVALSERPTITRAFTRSVRSSVMASVADVPARGARWLRRRVAPPSVNETDDPLEKASYLRAVAESMPS